MRLTKKYLPTILLPLAFLANPAVAETKTTMTVTNNVPGYKLLVSAEMLCGGTSDKNKKRKPFHDKKAVMPDGVPVKSTWKDCRLFASEYYDLNTRYTWGRVAVRVKDLETGDFVLVRMPTVGSDKEGASSKIIEVNGRTIRLDLYHGGYYQWKTKNVKYKEYYDKITTSLVVSEQSS